MALRPPKGPSHSHASIPAKNGDTRLCYCVVGRPGSWGGGAAAAAVSKQHPAELAPCTGSEQQGLTIMKSRVFLYVSTMAMSRAVGFFLTTSTLGCTPYRGWGPGCNFFLKLKHQS